MYNSKELNEEVLKLWQTMPKPFIVLTQGKSDEDSKQVRISTEAEPWKTVELIAQDLTIKLLSELCRIQPEGKCFLKLYTTNESVITSFVPGWRELNKDLTCYYTYDLKGKNTEAWAVMNVKFE